MEIGWYEDAASVYKCIGNTYVPKELAFAWLDNTPSCKSSPAELDPAGSPYSFKVHDNNQDAVWNFYRGPSGIWTSPSMLTFKTGILSSNGERVESGPARADFDGLDRMDASQDWVPWDSTSEYLAGSDDDGYKFCKYSNVHTGVANADACWGAEVPT